MPKALLSVFLIFIAAKSFSQSILLQEDFNAGIPSTWAIVNNDGATPHSAVSQFTNGWISYINNADTVAASTSYHSTTGTPSADYLITPKLNLLTVSKLSWDARSVDASYPDGYYVLISTDSLIASFTDTLLTVASENYIWNRKSVLLNEHGYTNQSVFIAFRNFTEDGFILEIDNVLIEASDFVSLTEPDQTLDFSIYPNPASNNLTIQTSEPCQSQIYSIDGQLVLTSSENNIDLSNLDTGTYLIRIESAKGSQTKKFVIE